LTTLPRPPRLPYTTLFRSSIALDSSGNAHVTGETTSSDFPTTAGAFDRTYHGASDAFVVKLNAAGDALIFSTLLGGALEDHSSRSEEHTSELQSRVDLVCR